MTIKIRTLIIDDMPLARERIRRVLSYDADIEIVGECVDGKQAVDGIRNLNPDLVFLDIHMPEMSGFDVIEKVSVDKMPVIVFVTAYDEFALRAFEVHAFDYLLKPFEMERMQETIARAKELIQKGNNSNLDQRLSDLIKTVRKSEKYLKRLAIKSRDKSVLLMVEEIDYIVSDGNYLYIHFGGKSHLIRASLQYFETRLDPEKFVRIHRSTIINVDSVKEMHPLFNGDQLIVMKDKKQLNLSRKYRDRLNRLLESF